MTNTTSSHWLDNLSDMFRPYQTSDGREGFEFSALVTADEYWFYQEALWPFFESRAAVKVTYDPRIEGQFAMFEVDCWDPIQGEAVAAALSFTD